MKITGEIKFFVEDKFFGVGDTSKTLRAYRTSISTKEKDGSYVKGSLDLVLSSKTFPQEKQAKLDPGYCYTLDVADGWLGVRAYQRKDGSNGRAFYIFCNKGKLTGKTKIDQSKREAYLNAKKGAKSSEEVEDDDLPF